MRIKNIIVPTFFICLILPLLSFSKTITYDKVKLKRAEIELIEDRLLDVGIFIFDPNIPENIEDDPLLFPEIRKAEATYMPYHLKNTLENSGFWGGVWVLPDNTKAMDLNVSGRIIESNGYDVSIEIGAWDISGKQWLDKTYKAIVGQSSYSKLRDPNEDPYQSLFNEIANDLQKIKSIYSSKELKRISEIGDLRYASDLITSIFNDYLVQDNKTRIYKISRLPADDDPTMQRINSLKERELNILDIINMNYEKLYKNIEVPYKDWRRDNRRNAISYEEYKRLAKQRKILGVVAILGGIMVDGDSNASGYAQQGLMIGGIQAVQSGFAKSSEAEIYKGIMEEGGKVLDSTAQGLLIEVEGQTLRLIGNAQEQFLQWKRLLKQIYTEETGITLKEDPAE